MAEKGVRYAPEFKRQVVDLERSGRSPASLAKEFATPMDDRALGPAGAAGYRARATVV